MCGDFGWSWRHYLVGVPAIAVAVELVAQSNGGLRGAGFGPPHPPQPTQPPPPPAPVPPPPAPLLVKLISGGGSRLSVFLYRIVSAGADAVERLIWFLVDLAPVCCRSSVYIVISFRE